MRYKMMFPKTVDEFMEQYKIVDSDKVYTNGAELIPIFRMKQWFEHVKAEPIRYGHWINVGSHDNLWRCSACGELQCCYGRYCATCGAKMDEVTE